MERLTIKVKGHKNCVENQLYVVKVKIKKT